MTPLNCSNAKIGKRISFKVSYPRAASDRFQNTYDENFHVVGPRIIIANKTEELHYGIIIGIRQVIMSDYKYHSAHKDWETGHEDGQAYATGKKEYVLFVVKNIRSNPFIVRFQDVEWFGD